MWQLSEENQILPVRSINLARIRDGTRRENIINQFAKSAEPKQRNIVIQGLWWALFVEKLTNVSL